MTGILNARIVASIAMLVFVGAAIAASTGAFFSDTETSTGNTFTAGDVDISISSIEHDYTGLGTEGDRPTFNLTNSGFSFGLGDLKPLDSGDISYNLGNGTNDAYLCAAIVETGNAENSLLEPETSAGDAGSPAGELGQFLSFKFNGNEGTLDGTWKSLGVISGGSSTSTAISYCFGTYVGGVCTVNPSPTVNQAQTDSVTADVQFYAVQTRNNPNFQCSSLPPVNGTTTPAIDWVESAQTGGDATEGPGATESGSNLLVLTTINDVNSRVRYSYDIADINLSAFTGFSYDSKQVSANDAVNGNASFRLVVDLDGDTNTAGDVKDVTFEPYYNILAHNSLNDASITTGAWQNWAATPADGKFWASGVTTSQGLSSGGGAYATNFTIAQLLAAYPSAKIVGISIGMGTYNVNQVVHVDNLIFNGVNLGFE